MCLCVVNVRKNDNVIMLNGKDRGKTGKVLFVFPRENKIVVEKLNTVARHLRARKQGQKGQIIHKERAVDASKVMLICKNCNKPTRVGHKITESKEKIRTCKRCGGDT